MNDSLFSQPIYSLPQAEKEQWMLGWMNSLVRLHRNNCSKYNNFLSAYGYPINWKATALEDIPPLAVRLFKQLDLKSVPPEEVFKKLLSSGTTGSPSRISLDRETARVQSKALVRIMQHWLGKYRLPMLIIDHPGVISDPKQFSARGAGIQGFSFLGQDHTYALKESMELDWESIENFYVKHKDQPVFFFGFTYMVWEYFLKQLECQDRRYQYKQGVLFHGGGWKKMTSNAVSPGDFKSFAFKLLGLSLVHDYYGMVEQVGSVFIECEEGNLHAPVFADVCIRSPGDWRPLPPGEPGVIEVLSVLPKSYPGHALLTEDLGILLGIDDCPCARLGRYFHVQGRIPKAEVRGCSDTYNQ